MKKRFAILPIILLLFLMACGTFQIGEKPATPQETYLKTRMQFNTIWMRYLDYYDLADSITQERWKRDIDPKFTLANKALDGWGAALNIGEVTPLMQARFFQIKNDLIDLLIPIFVKSVDKPLLEPPTR